MAGGQRWQKARTVKFSAGSALTQPIASSHVRATCTSEAFTITPAISKEWLEEPARMRTTPRTVWLRTYSDSAECRLTRRSPISASSGHSRDGGGESKPDDHHRRF